MSNQSNKEKMKARYQKALMNSLLDPNDEEFASLVVLPEHERPTGSDQQSDSGNPAPGAARDSSSQGNKPQE